jgi:hypothetical protein
MNRHQTGTKDILRPPAFEGENLGGRWVEPLPTQGRGELRVLVGRTARGGEL